LTSAPSASAPEANSKISALLDPASRAVSNVSLISAPSVSASGADSYLSFIHWPPPRRFLATGKGFMMRC
jgi:hypothetical protein